MFWEMPGPATAALALAFLRAGVRCYRLGPQMFVHHLDGDLAMQALLGPRPAAKVALVGRWRTTSGEDRARGGGFR